MPQMRDTMYTPFAVLHNTMNSIVTWLYMNSKI